MPTDTDIAWAAGLFEGDIWRLLHFSQQCACCGERWKPNEYRRKINRIYCSRKCKAKARYQREKIAV